VVKKIRVAILDDHQAIIDGYLFRLRGLPDFEAVATLHCGEELWPALKEHPADVLLLDWHIPNSPTDRNPYPVLYEIPKLIQVFPDLSILVISMHGQPALIQAVMEAGASGFILKEDAQAFQELPAIIRRVANQGIHLSPAALQAISNRPASELAKPLSGRQLEALSLCAAYPDASTSELANKMEIAHSTLRNLLSAAYLKLSVRTRAAAVLKAQQLGMIPSTPGFQPFPSNQEHLG
jgi:two-component system nitrate/nitrite response regulator NarL